MFRRKDEDETQDLLTEDGEAHVPSLGGTKSDKMNADTKDSAAAIASAQKGSSYPSYNSGRATTDIGKATSQSSATSYRPAAPSAPDITRSSRVPEYRPSASSATPTTGSSITSENKVMSGSRRVLTVGHDILLKGEIATCDRLVIEGSVDASLNEVHTVEIAETGSFKGSAEIEDAEISGIFEGDLTVRNRLVIYSTGKVRGKIVFGEIEIERGGELTGEIQTIAQAGSKGSSKRSKAKDEQESVAA